MHPMLEEKAMKIASLNRKIFELRTTLTTLEEERRVLKEEYKKLDYNLAMTDGRFNKVTKSTSKPSNPFANLTKDQILRIAAELEAL